MTDIRVIVDNDLKHNAEAVLKDLDLTMSQAVRMFLKQVALRKELPFNPYQRNFNNKTKSAIERSMEEKNLTTYKNENDLFNSWDD
jgi:DNA-damage-inducible protein J